MWIHDLKLDDSDVYWKEDVSFVAMNLWDLRQFYLNLKANQKLPRTLLEEQLAGDGMAVKLHIKN